MKIEKKEAVIEAILFAIGESVELDRIAITIDQDKETTQNIIRNMISKYQKEDRGIKIIELNDSYQMCTKPDMYEYLIRIAKQPKKHTLTDIVLETLSIIAYKQPITKLQVEKIRGVKSDHAVNKLIEYGLIEEAGRLNVPGKPMLFTTTEEFLRRFGIPSIEELPSFNQEQLDEFMIEAQEEAQLKLDI